MTVRQQWSVVALFVLILGGGLFAATRFMGDELFPVSVGSKAPDFHASTLDATPSVKSLDDYRGQVVLLNVWATWCVPCRIEMPSIEDLQREMGPRGLRIVAVSVDDPGQEQKVRDFAKQYGLTFEILHDGSGKIEKQYQTTGVPETFIIGRDGVIRKKVIGASRWDSDANRALLTQLLAESAP
ncbi:MAG TPA: TlpA disulfide reductase family protein [Gemmatimonadaceae bacterium]|nr:TlpA disulfide reductase family protein [Gemmatimonadaceae bacterium]